MAPARVDPRNAPVPSDELRRALTDVGKNKDYEKTCHTTSKCECPELSRQTHTKSGLKGSNFETSDMYSKNALLNGTAVERAEWGT